MDQLGVRSVSNYPNRFWHNYSPSQRMDDNRVKVLCSWTSDPILSVPASPLYIEACDPHTFIFNGTSYPVTLVGEAPHTELLSRTRSETTDEQPSTARRLQRFANVSHKAALKPSTNLDRVGQNLRQQRATNEKEKESKRAVLIDSAPNSRSSSRSRPSSSTTVPVSLGPAATPGSPRTSSPRPPSRLTAVPARPPPSTTSVNKRSPPSASSPPTTASQHPSPPHAVSPARQHSSASSESSVTSSSSALHASSSSTAQTSLSSGGSPNDATELALAKDGPITSSMKLGGGGVIKRKESLKKERTAKQIKKDQVAEAVRLASKPSYDSVPLPPPPPPREGTDGDDEDEEMDAEGEADDEIVVDPTPSTSVRSPPTPVKDETKKKKVRLLSTTGGDSTSDASSTAPKSKTSASTSASKVPSATTTNTASSTKKRKRQVAKSERWYSSSDDESEPINLAVSTSLSKSGSSSLTSSTKRRRTISASEHLLPSSRPASGSDSDRGRSSLRNSTSALPSHLSASTKGSPLRASSTPSAVSRASNAANEPERIISITSLSSFENYRKLFDETYPSYVKLFETLQNERHALMKSGSAAKSRYSVEEIARSVKRLEANRIELERIKLGLMKYKLTAGLL